MPPAQRSKLQNEQGFVHGPPQVSPSSWHAVPAEAPRSFVSGHGECRSGPPSPASSVSRSASALSRSTLAASTVASPSELVVTSLLLVAPPQAASDRARRNAATLCGKLMLCCKANAVPLERGSAFSREDRRAGAPAGLGLPPCAILRQPGAPQRPFAVAPAQIASCRLSHRSHRTALVVRTRAVSMLLGGVSERSSASRSCPVASRYACTMASGRSSF
jgi:hypothetical protein